MTPLPTSTSQPGWPEFLTDTNGDLFVRLRDGVPTSQFSGHACQYGMVDLETDLVIRDYLYTPTILATAGDVTTGPPVLNFHFNSPAGVNA
jgi:hypothetical protein